MIIFGTRTRANVLAIVRFLCLYCDTSAAQRVYERVSKFTLFFIPLFPYSRKYFVECVNCAATTALDRERVDAYVNAVANERIEKELDAEFGPA